MGKIPCSMCTMTFDTYSNLNLHKSQEHTATPRATEWAAVNRRLRSKRDSRLPPPPPPPPTSATDQFQLPPPPPTSSTVHLQLPPPPTSSTDQFQLPPPPPTSSPVQLQLPPPPTSSAPASATTTTNIIN